MRRNPDMLAEIMEEEEGEESTTIGPSKRKSTGNSSFDRRLKIPRDDDIMGMIDDVTTPRGVSSMTSVVPETPQGIIPLAHSTPMVGRQVSMIKSAAFIIPSPIREDEEEGERKREGRRPNRSILDDLSATMGEGERRGVCTQHDDEDFPPLVDLRHPREQEEEERRMSRSEENQGDLSCHIRSPDFQHPGPSTIRQNYGREESPELFGKSDIGDDKKEHENVSESAALRVMLDEEEEEKEKTMKRKEEEEDSFDDDSIEILEQKKEEKKATPSPIVDSSSAVGATVLQSTSAIPAAAPSYQPTAAARSTTSLRSSQDSFYHDEIVDSPEAAPISPAVTASSLHKISPSASAAQPIRADDHDSFDDDDDFVATSSRSKENTLRSVGRTTPTSGVSNGRSVEVTEGLPSSVAQKTTGSTRGLFAEDIFGLNSLPNESKAVSNQSNVKNTPVRKNGKTPSTAFSSFSFFADESPSGSTPAVTREDSDFVDSSPKQTTSATRTPRGRGRGRGGRGLPRKVDPNSKVNQTIREQSTPVRISPRPPSRISEIVGSFEDEEFDVSGFDD
ncbi:hypothetical protein PMAYCL1PPCAC_06504 [Pristionchus mayeri]|uniref:Uncharacterized protein n=1 Tax=Pristionchus mayeri TaxID=1317129 RepID=A0AAN4ZAD9_9BILA|nr:hypothetical protein PMAYCL1PPCAC_06504 [Pristionchus mayeri]